MIQVVCGSQFNKKRKVLNVVTPEVAAALDRTGTSSRSATYILPAAAIRKDYDDLSIRKQHKPNVYS